MESTSPRMLPMSFAAGSGLHIETSMISTLTIYGPIERADLPGLYARTCVLLDRGITDVLLCELVGVAADAVALDALARLALAASRRGCRLRLRGASTELDALVRFMGLDQVLRG